MQLVESVRSLIAKERVSEALLNELTNQEFQLTDDEIQDLRYTVKGLYYFKFLIPFDIIDLFS